MPRLCHGSWGDHGSLWLNLFCIGFIILCAQDSGTVPWLKQTLNIPYNNMIAASFFSTSAGSASQPGTFPHLTRCNASLTSSNRMMSPTPASTDGGSDGGGSSSGSCTTSSSLLLSSPWKSLFYSCKTKSGSVMITPSGVMTCYGVRFDYSFAIPRFLMNFQYSFRLSVWSCNKFSCIWRQCHLLAICTPQSQHIYTYMWHCEI